MLISVLKSKIAYAKVTETELFYEGSITMPEDIIEKANMQINEKVMIVNLQNGERAETYVIPGPRNSKKFALNGPLARKAAIGDEIHILSFGLIDPSNESIEPVIIDLKTA
jgi:aspartate 1-decarboxylase